jgi:hypothetical protein
MLNKQFKAESDAEGIARALRLHGEGSKSRTDLSNVTDEWQLKAQKLRKINED